VLVGSITGCVAGSVGGFFGVLFQGSRQAA